MRDCERVLEELDRAIYKTTKLICVKYEVLRGAKEAIEDLMEDNNFLRSKIEELEQEIEDLEGK